MSWRLICVGALLVSACTWRPSVPGVGGGVVAGGGEHGARSMKSSCIETYTLQNLAKRSWAFDGTVISSSKAETETGADTVTFHVNRWFKGGNAPEVTLQTYGLGGITSAGAISGRRGDRLLVTGEENTLWTCGFTQPYTPQAAAEWEATFTTPS